MGEIVFNGISSRDLGVEVQHRRSFVGPERDYTVVEVKGRHGSIIQDNGNFKSYDREYEIAIYKYGQSLVDTVDNVIGWLRSAYGYARLEDSYDPDHYVMAVYKEETEIENIVGMAGSGRITFTCAPQRWLKSGEEYIRITAEDLEDAFYGLPTITNPTINDAYPIIVGVKENVDENDDSGFITVSNAYDTYTIYVGYELFTEYELDDYVIDCQNHDTYGEKIQNDSSIAINMNSVSYGTYPVLAPGINRIMFSGFDYIEIQPRWWIV